MSRGKRVSRETPTQDELDAIEPSRYREVPIRSERLEVRPLTVGRLPAFARAVRPLLGTINSIIDAGSISLEVVLGLIETDFPQLVEVISVATDKPVEWLSDAEIDEFAELATAVISANLDFFVRRLLPTSEGSVRNLAAQLLSLIGSGPTPSSSSSAKGTA